MKHSTHLTLLASSFALFAQPAAADIIRGIPVYPNATKVPSPANMPGPPDICGSKVTLTVYNVNGADAVTVAKWYQSRLPGAITIDETKHLDEGPGSASFQVYRGDGSAAINVNQLDTKLAQGLKKFSDGDLPLLGIETFNPPLRRDVIALQQRAANADDKTGEALKKQFVSMCGGGGE